MNLQEMLTHGGGTIILLLTLIQIAPVQINPWSALAKIFGRAINADVLAELKVLKEGQKKNQTRLDEHIRVDNERDADQHRIRILGFNTELLRDMRHTREDFIDILGEIDFYEHYCADHPEYENNRAVLAISNIKRVYDERQACHDFL